MSSSARGSFLFVLLLLCTEHPLCTLVAEEGAEEEGERIEERERKKRGRGEGGRREEEEEGGYHYLPTLKRCM